MHNKRGMSAVVTTLIIILLTIVALGIVWVVVKNILDKGSDEISLTGITLDLEITRAVVDDETGILSVTVKRNTGDGDLVGINFVISDGDYSVVVRRDTTLAELGMETFTFTLSNLAVNEITSISVAPIFETESGKEATGEIIDTATYSSGAAGSGGGPSAGGDDGGDDGGDGGCTPTTDCVAENAECGQIDDGCELITCGDCTVLYGAGWMCDGNNNSCYDSNDCTPMTPIEACTTPNADCGFVSPGCGEPLVDCTALNGNCSAQHGGEPNWECVENFCDQVTYVNDGSVVWFGPPGVTRYFSSDSLPDPAVNNYGSHFVTFPNLLPTQDCYFILNYNYDYDVYEYVIVELLLTEAITINLGESYQIWESNPDCCDSLANPGPNCSS